MRSVVAESPPVIMVRSFEVVNFVFTSSRVVKTVHLDLHTGTFPYPFDSQAYTEWHGHTI